MTHDTLAADVSKYQRKVNNLYRRQWLIIRACDGTIRDEHFASNYAWCVKATAKRLIYPKLKGFTVYVVYRPGVDVLRVLQDMVPTPHPKMTVMIDVESWGGQIAGDHSADITHLAEQIGAWLGSRQRVLAYGNQGDLAAIFPNRPAWLQLIVAGYSTVQPQTAGLIGWQYTDGETKWPVPSGLPRRSAPFGRCDHNVFPGLTPGQLADALGVGTPQEDELSQKEVDEIKAAIADVGKQVTDGFAKVMNEFRADNGHLYRAQTLLEHVPGYRPFKKLRARRAAKAATK